MINHLTKRIREDEPRAKKAKEQNATLFRELEAQHAKAKKIESVLIKLGYEEGKEERIRNQQNELEDSIRQLTKQVDNFRQQVPQLSFDFSDPTPNFDRSKVKGLVAELFTLDDTNAFAGQALEVCAGGRLYHLVVDSNITGTQLLENGNLRKRITIIPLNKIQSSSASDHVSPSPLI
jgi:structural maintenance of chromosome 2